MHRAPMWTVCSLALVGMCLLAAAAFTEGDEPDFRCGAAEYSGQVSRRIAQVHSIETGLSCRTRRDRAVDSIAHGDGL